MNTYTDNKIQSKKNVEASLSAFTAVGDFQPLDIMLSANTRSNTPLTLSDGKAAKTNRLKNPTLSG
ncbi:hypothetical protein [Vibrio gigantis]|uniref:hypothetical protein n=1 Tax=Vibrio gigantis TaxID=296199 RepID=UPI001BFD20C6|nr:hypothetical protein [Vibrio gigantis]